MRLLDTNVLMVAPNEILKGDAVVSIVTVEELEKHKAGFETRNVNSRRALRNMLNRIKIEGTHFIRDTVEREELNDDTIINEALEGGYLLVTNDVAMMVKACNKCVETVSFDNSSSEAETVAYSEFNVPQAVPKDINAFGVRALNKEQGGFISCLLNPKRPLVICSGGAGSGKTLLTLAAGMELLEREQIEKIVLLKPCCEGEHEIGFLKGTKEEKLKGSSGNFFDALEFILGGSKAVTDFLEKGFIQWESLGMIRGRSFAKSLVILDEAQNTSYHDVKTLLTRIGEGSKVVLLGDLSQIDNSKCSRDNNGLVHSAKLFTDSKLTSSIILKETVRSALCQEAIERFK